MPDFEKRASDRSIERFLSDALVIGSLVAVYALLQFWIDPDWPAWILTPVLVLTWRYAFLRAEAAGTVPAWLSMGGVGFVTFAAVYTPLQWLIPGDLIAWIVTAIILGAGWILLSVASVHDD